MKAGWRKPLLGTIAGALLCLLAMDALTPTLTATRPPRGDAAPAADQDPRAEPVPSPDLTALRQRYQVILRARPFITNTFLPQKKPKTSKRRKQKEQRRDPPKPTQLRLRLTGFLGQGALRAAVLEEGGSGRGLLARQGDQLGPHAVARVQSASLVFLDDEEERELSLGDPLELPLELSESLQRFHEASSSPKTPVASQRGSPPISEDKKNSILERLRKRRKSSYKQGSKKGVK